jgi:hypothetical protein
MDLSIRQGETLILSTTNDDLTADTLQLLVSNSNDVVVINETENFTTTNGIRGAEIRTNETDLPTGEYTYMLIVTYADGTIEKLPNTEACDGDCSLPTLTICESITAPGVS